jgi:transcriptional regulator GlxA family with amidase domain
MQNNGYQEAIRIYLCEWLLNLNRHAQKVSAFVAHSSYHVTPPWIREALRLIDERIGQQLHSASLARAVSVSPAHFSRVFKQQTGMNVTDYVHAKRVVHAKELLAQTENSIAQIAERCGFESMAHFHRIFKRITGPPPKAYRKNDSSVRSDDVESGKSLSDKDVSLPIQYQK